MSVPVPGRGQIHACSRRHRREMTALNTHGFMTSAGGVLSCFLMTAIYLVKMASDGLIYYKPATQISIIIMNKNLILSLTAAVAVMFGYTSHAQTPATLTDLNGYTPTPTSSYDILLLDVNNAGQPGGLNYYNNNGDPPGQIFLTPATNPGGYVLTNLALLAAVAAAAALALLKSTICAFIHITRQTQMRPCW